MMRAPQETFAPRRNPRQQNGRVRPVGPGEVSSRTYDGRGRLSTGSRIALAAASLLLLLVYVLPIWKINLDAPQYPEGLGLYIEVNTVRGIEQGNLESINALNHYIGMKSIDPESIPELDIMPWLMAGLIVLGLAAALIGRRWALYAWVGVFLAIALVGLADFYRWEYDYGHNLDHERAILKVPGMNYQPPLIGSKQMLNIKATSLPALGGIAVFISLFAGIGIAAFEIRLRKMRHGALLGAVAAMSLVVGCATGPRPIAYGEDACFHCKMTITDPRFGAELVSAKGKVQTFDSIECLREFMGGGETGSALVTDFASPGELIPAEDAHFVHGGGIMSPMGGSLAAFRDREVRDRFVVEEGGEALSWRQVVMRSRYHEEDIAGDPVVTG